MSVLLFLLFDFETTILSTKWQAHGFKFDMNRKPSRGTYKHSDLGCAMIRQSCAQYSIMACQLETSNPSACKPRLSPSDSELI